MIRMLYVFLAVLIFLAGCKEQEKKAEEDTIKKATNSETKAVEQNEEAGEVKSWGYDDKPSSTADLTREPPLEVKGGLVHDIGTIIAGEKKLYILKLRNTSDKPWKLQDIEADCSCTNIDGIPGGVYLQPGEDFEVPLRIDGGKIGEGQFEKHITLLPLEYKRVRVSITGRIEYFYTTIPPSRRIIFNPIREPSAKWENSIVINGIGQAKDKLELQVAENLSPKRCIQANLEKLSENSWKLTARPIRTLPYAASFTENIKLKVLHPEGMPPVSISVQGRVGTDIRWRRLFMHLTEADFNSGIANLKFQLGIDLNDASHPVNQRYLSEVEKVDWQKLFDSLEFKAPEGVTFEKTFTRFGVRLEVKAPRAAFNDKNMLCIESGCNGNWEGVPIRLRIKKGRNATKTQ